MELGMHDLPAAGSEVHARDINELGQVVGFADDHALLWQYNASMESWAVLDLGTLDGTPARAWAINNCGQIAGAADSGASERAVVWTYDLETGTWTATDLGEGGAYCLNDVGQIGGRSMAQACIWAYEYGSAEWTPGAISGRTLSADVVYGMNNAGEAVGESGGHAVLWKDDQVIDLNGDLTGVQGCLTLRAAWDINDAGKIVGSCTYGGSEDLHVFVMARSCNPDCNENLVLDACDIYNGTSQDQNGNGIPDDCPCESGIGGSKPPKHDDKFFVTLVGPTPNTVGHNTEISFSLDRPRRVRVSIYDVTGRQVACIADGRFDCGSHRVAWAGRNDSGHVVSPGIYMLRMESEGAVASRKIVLVK
jgi:probable HAF family extracellular repeat protein